jgi:hypothetical protein
MSAARSRRKGGKGELEVLHIGQDKGFAVTKSSPLKAVLLSPTGKFSTAPQ